MRRLPPRAPRGPTRREQQEKKHHWFLFKSRDRARTKPRGADGKKSRGWAPSLRADLGDDVAQPVVVFSGGGSGGEGRGG